MNKIIILLIVFFGVFGSSSLCLATNDLTISLPSGDVYKPGDTFKVIISAFPSEKIYTAGIHLEYPQTILRVESFSFSSTWMPLSQEGYDTIDNINGLLVKTAGYPGGLSSLKKFGEVTFKAIKEGQGKIQLIQGSFMLNSQNINISEALGTVSVRIATPEIVEDQEETIPAESNSKIDKEENTVEVAVLNQEETNMETVNNIDKMIDYDSNERLLASISQVVSGAKYLLITSIISLIGIIAAWLIKKYRINKNNTRQ